MRLARQICCRLMWSPTPSSRLTRRRTSWRGLRGSCHAARTGRLTGSISDSRHKDRVVLDMWSAGSGDSSVEAIKAIWHTRGVELMPSPPGHSRGYHAVILRQGSRGVKDSRGWLGIFLSVCLSRPGILQSLTDNRDPFSPPENAGDGIPTAWCYWGQYLI